MTKLNSNKLQKGDILSRTSYMTVVYVHKSANGNRFIVKNEEGLQWDIDAGILEREAYSHNQFDSEVKVSRTELVDIFMNVGDAIFTVNFDKLPVADNFLEIVRGEGGKILSYAEITKRFKKFKGENRTLVGYAIKREPGFGRTTVIDMNIPDTEHKVRLVDHRTINSLIVKNVKYVVK